VWTRDAIVTRTSTKKSGYYAGISTSPQEAKTAIEAARQEVVLWDAFSGGRHAIKVAVALLGIKMK